MNDKNVTADENAPEEVAVVDETPVVVEEAESAEVAVAPVADTAAASAEAPAVENGATGEVAAAPVQTVYVTAPTPPWPKGNRGIGTLLAIVAAIAFAVVYLGVVALLNLFADPASVGGAVSSFLTSTLFYVPVLVFLVMMILWALIANRASWWSWVIGSLIIAVVTYFASIGILLLLAGGFGLTASQGTAYFVALAVNPALIAAALVARECAIWFGAAIAKRGRKVREGNYAAWQAFENEEAQKRAEFAGSAAS